MSKRLQVLYDNEEYLKIQASPTVPNDGRMSAKRYGGLGRTIRNRKPNCRRFEAASRNSRPPTSTQWKIEAGHAVMRSNRVNDLSFDHGFESFRESSAGIDLHALFAPVQR